ncbi:MAG: hypothetical protein KGM16_09200 [Bacteroidota bacterium]|nr:hypothetical protein [Bacteroidota bacterium]
MRKAFIIIFAFNSYFINTSYAQKTISLNTASAAGYNLNAFKKIEVINNLPDSTCLGFIPSNVMNDRKYIKPSGAITNWLQDFVNKQFGSNADAKANSLLWVIQDLSLGTDSTQKQVYSFVKLKADIYTGDELNYQMVNTFDSTWIVNGDADFGQMLAQSFIELYKNSIEQSNGTANIRFQQMLAKPAGTKNDIINEVKLSHSYPIVKATKYPRGVYTSFEEFENNTPSIANFYADVNKKNNQVELYQIMADSSSQLIPKAWGISISNELYFYADGQLYPIEKSGNTFYMAKYLEPRTRKNQAFYWRQIIGARQGDTNPYNDAHVLRKTVLTAENVSLEATHLDFDQQDFIY